jgi:MurNAc alpha-1-phosphate uridylyltransferase
MTLPLMIFAAGFGTRMRPLTDDRPKPMIALQGRPLIDHALDIAAEAGADPVVVNTHYRAETLEDHLKGRDVHVLREAPKILDTGGGLRNARTVLGPGPVWTMNPDVLWLGPNPLRVVQDAWRPDEMDACLLCIPPEGLETGAAEDFSVDAAGRLSRGPGLHYGGVQIIRTEALDGIDAPAFSLNLVWDRLIAAGRCFAAVYPGRWCDIGTPENLGVAQRLLREAARV